MNLTTYYTDILGAAIREANISSADANHVVIMEVLKLKE